MSQPGHPAGQQAGNSGRDSVLPSRTIPDSIVSQKKTVSSLKAVRGWHEAPHVMKGNGFTQSLLLQMSITSTKNTFTTTSRPVSDQTAGHRSPAKRTRKRNHRGDRIQSLGKEKFLGDVGF